MLAGVIYVVTNMHTGDQYVGLTSRALSHRWSEHKTKARGNKNTHFYNAIRKYGVRNFEAEEYISVLDKHSLCFLEQQVIKDLKPKYNQTSGGEVTFGRKYTEEIKEKIRRSNTGKKRTLEQIKNITNAVHASTVYMNRIHSEENKKHLALARGKIDQVKRIEAARLSATSREWSDESKAKLSKSCMGRRYGQDVIDRMKAAKCKPIRCNETGEIYLSREEAAYKTGISKRTIFRDVSGEPRRVNNNRFTFSYIQDLK